MSRTYTERPPAGAKAARHAWDYFVANYPKKKIGTLAYSPNCNGLKSWVVEWKYTEKQMDVLMSAWGMMYGTQGWMADAPAYKISQWSR